MRLVKVERVQERADSHEILVESNTDFFSSGVGRVCEVFASHSKRIEGVDYSSGGNDEYCGVFYILL